MEQRSPPSEVHHDQHVALRIVWLHDTRHGTATLPTATATAIPPRIVKEILGHSQIAVPMNAYPHVIQDNNAGL